VDNRLFQIWGLRPANLRKEDLPEVARAIVSLYRRKAQVTTGITKNVSYVLITGRGLKVQVLAEDWAKIMPFIKDGTFDQTVLRSEQDNAWIDPKTAYDISTLDQVDRQYYLRILGTLQGLFP
jgi:hypothetical protein